MFADAAGDEIFHAPKVPEHAPVGPGQPVQETREDVVHLGEGAELAGLQEARHSTGYVIGGSWAK